MNDYYVYGHFNAITGEIFYIGKGKGWRAKALSRRSVLWHNYVKKYGYTIQYLETNLTQEEAFEKEVYYIKKYGRRDLKTGCLVNMSDGGVGGNNNKGRKLSAEWRRKIGEAGRGRPGAMLGKKHPEETKRKISEANKGRKTPWVDVSKLNERKICPYCNIDFRLGSYALFHGERCKHNPNRPVLDEYRTYDRGEKHHGSKISDKDAVEIRELYNNQSDKSKKQIAFELSEKYGISTHSIRHIGRGDRRTGKPISNEPRINPNIKLTDGIVKEIRQEFSLGCISIVNLSKKYGVSSTCISDIIHYKAWKNVA